MSSGLTIQQPRNGILDAAELIRQLQPILIGSGPTNSSQTDSQTNTNTSTQTQDPAVAAQTNELIRQFTQRANSTAQADRVVEDILYRAQLAFAPVLGEEKKSGLYNTTTRNLLAKEAVARATAASAEAVLRDQQQAAQVAAQLQGAQVANTGVKTSSGTSTASRTGTQRTRPAVTGKGILKAAGTSLIAGTVVREGNKLLKKGAETVYDYLRAPGPGYDTGSLEDISGNIYDPDALENLFVDSGAVQAAGSAGMGELATGYSGGESLGAGAEGSIFTDDTDALQMLIDSTNIPTIDSGVQVATAGGVIDSGASTVEDSGVITGADAVADTVDVVTTGAPPMPPAIPVDTLTGIPNAMPPAITPDAAGIAMPPAITVADAGLADWEASMLEVGISPDAIDPFSFDPSAVDLGADIGGDVAVSAGVDTAADAVAAADAADAAGSSFDFLNSVPIPYFAIANAISGGELGEAVADIPVVGDVLGEVGEFVNDVPIVGELLDEGGELVNNVVDEGGEILEAVVDSGGEFIQENILDPVDDVLSGDSVVCTESIRQKLLSAKLVAAEAKWNMEIRKLSPITIRGYHYIATPLVIRMRGDRNFANKMAILAEFYCKQILGIWSPTGWMLKTFGEALCWLVGKFVVPANFNFRKVIYGG